MNPAPPVTNTVSDKPNTPQDKVTAVFAQNKSADLIILSSK
jgi:hypothetical protein